MSVEKTLEEMGLKLPSVPAPVAAYVPGVLDGSLVYTSGQLPTENGALRKGKLGADMTVEEGVALFENHPRIRRKLQTLYDVGLGYIKIGQPSTQLSGGEAQRVKLATELSRRSTGRTIYVLDEPTTGLHTADVHKLIEVLQTFVEEGNTVVVIEHNLDMIKSADYIIDLGPEGGDRGGRLVACGTPEQVAANKKSYTGAYLAKILERDRAYEEAACSDT